MAKRRMNKLLRIDWDIIAGIAAAMMAIVLHLLHIVETDVLLTIVLVLLALLLFRDLRRESSDEQVAHAVEQTRTTLQDLHQALEPPDAVLIGPRRLRAESSRFSETARGEMLWFNVCFTMFKTQQVIDLMLRPAIENTLVDSIQFVSSETERELWNEYMLPKIQACDDSQKVREPRWCQLPETISFILAEVEPHGGTEALLSFWGEPFMSRTTGIEVPRYIFRVQQHSELVPQLVELERHTRIG